MKNKFFKKALSVFTAMAMSTSILIGVPFDFGVTVEANAEDYNPSVITYATAEQLGDSTTFAPNPVNGVGNNIVQVYFGEKDGTPIPWYILGGDSSVQGNNMMLFATTNLASGKQFRAEPNDSVPTAMPYENGDGDYSGTAPDSVYANHYGASDLREYFNNMATDSGVFSEEEQALLNETTITTYDEKNDTSYTTTDKLYALQVVGNALCIGPENTMLSRGIYWEDGVFLSRTPNVNIDFDFYEESVYCRCIYIMNASGNPITSTMSNLYNGYRPATNIDLSDVLFASCAAVGTTSEYKINTYTSNNLPPLTLRLDGSDKNIGTVTYTGDTITAKKGTTNEMVAIVVQGKDNDRDWSCSKVITGTETITKEDIENSSSMFTVSGELSDCRIWLEIVSEDNLRYAVTATQVNKQTQTITASDVTLTYGETGKKISATTDGDGVLSYEVTTGEDVISVLADGTITALKAGTATVTINAAETADYAAATTTVSVTVNKKKIAVPAADTTEYTYNGTAQTYGVTSTDDYTVTGGTQTDAGEYPITITLNNENYEWDGTLGTYKFVINKAAVTVTAKSYTIKVGDTLPTYAYDVAGLVNGETLPIDVTISCNAADSNTAGTYTITVSGAANSTNYTFAYVNGTLTISNKLEQTITASDVTLTYGETGKKISATTNGNGAISYSTTSDVISVAADGTITAHKAGTATVTINVAETDTYAAATKTVTVTVNKATKTEDVSDDGKAAYKITKSDLEKGTVTYVAPTDAKATTVTIPATVEIDGVEYSVTAIEKNAFKKNKNLKTVTIGKNVKTIGANAFYNCTKLKTVKVGSNVTTIGDKAFYKCTALTKISLPSKVKTIGKSAFEGCKKVTSVTIGKSVAKIGEKAFYGCSKVKTLTIKSTKLTTKKIGSKAFAKTPKTMTVKVPKKKFTAYKSMLIKKGVNKKAKFKKA